MDETGLDELVRRARRHEARALSTLVERYSPRVFGLLFRMTGSRDVAEDLMQETFLRVVRTIGRYTESGRFESWLFRIAANLARDRARQSKRRGTTASLHADDDDGPAPDFAATDGDRPDARLERNEIGQRLEGVLASLSDAEREIILLRHFSGLSFREIAEVLSVPLGTALARAHRALKRMRDAMRDEVRE